MKTLALLILAGIAVLPADAALARGGGGGSHSSSHSSMSSVTVGGAAGTSPTAPGTNSLGTALSNGPGNGIKSRGPELGANPAVDREEKQVDKAIGSICRGC
jgi:hypothetical protein